jgi:hypothetical protein
LLALSIVSLAQTSNSLSAADAWDGDRFHNSNTPNPIGYDPVKKFSWWHPDLRRKSKAALSLGTDRVDDVPRELLSRGNDSLAKPNGANAHSGKFKYTTPDFKFPTFPFASGIAQIGFGNTNWHLSGNGWMTTNPPRSFVTGTTKVDLQVNACINWGIIEKEKVISVVPSHRGSMTLSFFYSVKPFIEFKKDIKLNANASFKKIDRQTNFSSDGTDSLNTAVNVSALVDAGVTYVYRVGKVGAGEVPRVAQRGIVQRLSGSLVGKARLTTPVQAVYDQEFIPTNGYYTNCIWTQFDDLRCTIVGENSIEEPEFGGKLISRVTYTARASNVYSAIRRWLSGSPS